MHSLHNLTHSHLRTSNTAEKMQFLLGQFSSKCRQLGIPAVAHGADGLQKFQSLSAEKQNLIYKNFSTYYDICATAFENGVDLQDEKFSLVWWACQRLKLRPTSDFFSHLTKGDIVEIYGLDFIQVFRTFEFFKYLSYSLDQVFCYEFWELFRRDAEITESILAIAKKYIDGDIRALHRPEVPAHHVEEVFSTHRYNLTMSLQYFAPFFDTDGNLAAIGSVFRVLDFKNSAPTNNRNQQQEG